MLDELHCPVCCTLFEDPVRLRCSHHMCQSHVEDLATSSGILVCPVCSEATSLPTDTGLPVDTVLNSVLEVWKEVPANGQDGDEHVCGFCSAAVGTRWCAKCGGHLCEDCERTEHSKVLFRNHQVVDVAESSSRSDEITARMLCQQHPEERLKFYCLDCSMQVCSHCLILGDHKNHDQTQLIQAYSAGRDSLVARKALLTDRLGAAEDLLVRLQDLELEIQKKAEVQRDAINQELDHLKELIETKRSQLLSRSHMEEQQKRTQLHAQLDSTEECRQLTQRLLERADAVLATTNEHAFLAVVLPLIQDMKNSDGHPPDTSPSVGATFRPFSVEAQLRSLGDLDLGVVSTSTGTGSPTGRSPPQKMTVVRAPGTLPQPPTAAFSALVGGAGGVSTAPLPTASQVIYPPPMQASMVGQLAQAHAYHVAAVPGSVTTYTFHK